MDANIIGLIIKWGPLALVGLVFLIYFLGGVIKGTYKVTRRLVYVVIYVLLAWLLVGSLTSWVLDMNNITINGVRGIRNFIVKFVEENETIKGFLEYSPELKSLIIDHPEIIVNPIVFIVLIVVVLPLSFPIYWIYLLIWNLIAKYAFKREKYQKDEDGNILRNEKGKKVKVERKKRRLIGGLINGVKGAVVVSSVLMPINFVNRIYNKAKDSAELEEGETLCGSIGFANINEDICGYIDMYNETLFAKMSGKYSLDKLVNDKLTTVKVDGGKIKLEKELSNLTVAFVLINDSGIIDLFTKGDIDWSTVDLSVIKFEKINSALDVLFSSTLLASVSEAGVNYVMNEVLNDNLVSLLKDDDIVSKLSYESSDQIRDELKNVVNVFKYAIDKGLDNVILDNKDNVISIVNNVNEEDVRELVNKLLSIRIVSKAMPSALKAYAEKYGINVPSEMTSELNNEVASQLVNAIKFVKTMEATSLDDITKGDIVDNLSNLLFVNGALKTNSKESLATLLHELNSSYLFKDVVSTQVNNLLKDKDYKVDARVLKYVDSKDDWLKELSVLEKGFDLYKEFNDTETVYYEKVTGLLNDLSGTKVMISILPFAYDELLPKIGIELDSEGLPSIDFDGENEDSSKKEFYDTWEDELVVLKNIADAAGDLRLQSLDDITVDLLKEEEKVESLSVVMSEVYKSDMLREPFVDFMKDTMNEFVVDYGVEFTKEELLSVDTKDKWKNEFDNINEVLSVDFSDEENIDSTNLKTVFDAVDSMELFKTKKIDILKYAVKESNFLTQEEYDGISWPSSDDQDSIDAYWDNETSILLKIVDKKDTIETLTTSVELKTMDTDEIGGLLNDVMDSNILKNIVADKMVTLFTDNDVRDDRDEGNSTVNLKNNVLSVSDWKSELSSIQEMVNISEENMNEVENGKTRVESMFDSIEESELLQNTRANLLLKAVKTIDITKVPDDVTVGVLKANNYSKYNNEKNVIINVSKEKELFDELGTMSLDTMDTDRIGTLMNTVTSSIIFKDYVVDEITKVLVNNDVKDDRDANDSTVYLKENIANVNDWKVELATVKKMNSSIDEISVVKYIEIVELNRYSRSGEEGNYSYTQDNEGEYLKDNGQYYLIEKTYRYNRSGEEGDYSYTRVDDGNYLKITETKVDDIFASIEASQLLQNSRANLLLKAVRTIDITEVPSTVTVDSLRDNNYAQYNNEKMVIIKVSKEKNMFDNLGSMELKNIDIDKFGDLMDTVAGSVIFKDYFVGEIVKVFVSNELYDDRDYGTSKTVNLQSSIASVTSWKSELEIVQDMLNMNKDNFNEIPVGDTRTRIEIMFDNIEDSELLKYKRANLLIKAIKTINLADVSIPTGVTVKTLSDDDYAQYGKETNVFVVFAENRDAIDNLNDITKLGASKNAIANVLDAMKESKIFETKYVNTIDTSLSSINNNQDLKNYGVVFKTKEQTNNYKDIVWSNEINNLTTISDNINTVSKYDKTSIDTPEERVITVGIIGSTLDAVSGSQFLGNEQTDKIADSVISALTNGLITNVDKDANKTWSQVFTEALEIFDMIPSL